MKDIALKCISICFIVFNTIFYCEVLGFESKTLSTTKIVTLDGKVLKEKGLDANGKLEYYYGLQLMKPINVDKNDDGGPAKNVKKIQMIFLPSKFNHKTIKHKYLNKKVVVSGKLFYPISAHHHTKILLEVDAMALKGADLERGP